jgi:4-amino-4-deoxy-L-arabinose transferase-like glycosyltransferase
VRSLLILLLFALVVRVALWILFIDLPIRVWDENDYNNLALNLVQHHEFSLEPHILTSIRPPLYPGFVAALYSQFGVNNFNAVRIAQLIISLLTVVALYYLAADLSSRRVALIAAGLYSFYPSMLGFNNLVLTEVLFTFLLILTCLAAVRAFKHGSLVYFTVCGALLGGASLARSVLWLFPPFLALFILCSWKVEWKRRLAAGCLVVLAYVAVILPWTIRNTKLQKTLVTIDVMGGRNFMMGNYEYTPLYRTWDVIALEGDRSWSNVLAAEIPGFRLLTQGEKDRLAMRRGVQFILKNPWLSLKRSAIKFFNFWQLERELVAGAARGYFGALPPVVLMVLTAVIFGSYALVMLTGIYGMVMCPLPDRRLHGFLLLIMAFICGLHILAYGHSRYHLPLIPLILVYSAMALTHGGQLWHRRQSLSFKIAGALCGVIMLSWIIEIVLVDFERYVAAWRSLI